MDKNDLKKGAKGLLITAAVAVGEALIKSLGNKNKGWIVLNE